MEPFALHSDELELSIPTTADVDRITEVCQDPEIQRWTTIPSPYARADAEGFVRHVVGPDWERGAPTWAIRLRADDGTTTLVGMVGLHDPGHGRAEVGYWLDPSARGAGVMHRAVGLVLDVGFDRFGLESVQWRADLGNWTSWRVAWRHGFRKEGMVRRLGVRRGRRLDQWIGTLLRDDPREPAAPWDGPAGRATDAGAAADADASVDPDALVREFHRAFAVPVADDGADVTRDRIGLRMALVAEEFSELVTAVYGRAAGALVETAVVAATSADDGTRDTVAAADALGDIVYIIYGMALECGIPLPAVLAEIHASNMSKLGSDGRPVHRADGKVLKGPSYRPPDVAGVLAASRSGR